jgi:hypothetical protein
MTIMFGCDRRVLDVWVRVCRTGAPARGAPQVGVERRSSRTQFQNRLRGPSVR